MSERLKRLLPIIGFVALGLTMGIFLWYLFFRPTQAPPTQALPSPSATGTLPQPGIGQPGANVSGTAPGQIGLPSGQFIPQLPPQQLVPSAGKTTVLSSGVELYPSLAPTGDTIRSYNPTDGKFYTYDKNGNAIALSDKAFFDVQNTTWANTQNKAILEFPDGSKILYDFDQSQQYSLPAHWQDFSFSPKDNQIAAKAIGDNPDNRFLVIANPDGSNAKAIESLGDNQDKVDVSWSPNNQVVAFSHTADPIGFDREQIVMVGQNKENFKNLVVEGRGFVPNWSPDGSELLYSVYSQDTGFRPSLWISGSVGDQINANRKSLNIQTWADKCAWKSTTEIVCGVPEALDQGAGMQRDLFANVPDNIETVNLQTGTILNLGRPEANTVVDKMTVSADGSAILYTDRLTGKLVRFAL